MGIHKKENLFVEILLTLYGRLYWTYSKLQTKMLKNIKQKFQALELFYRTQGSATDDCGIPSHSSKISLTES